MNLDSKVWKASDYDKRFTSEVFAIYGSLDDEKERERVQQESLGPDPSRNHSSPQSLQSPSRRTQPGHPPASKESDDSDGDDEYDFVDIRSEKEKGERRGGGGGEPIPEASRATSLTSYFGSVASALYNNAASSHASLASSLTGSSSSGNRSGGARRWGGREGTRGQSSSRRDRNSNRGRDRVGPSSTTSLSLSSSTPSPSFSSTPSGQNHTPSSARQGQEQGQGSTGPGSSSTAPAPAPAPAPAFSGHSSVALSHTAVHTVPLPKLRILIMAVVSTPHTRE